MRGMRKAADIAFIAVAVVVLCGVIGRLALQPFFPALKQPAQSAIEGRTFAEYVAPTLETFADGSYQQNSSDFISETVPFRDEAVLSDAFLQRAIIACANMPFAFPSYPTYFDSDTLVIASRGTLQRTPEEDTTAMRNGLVATFEAMKDAAEKHPDVRFVAYMIGGNYQPAVSPTYDLMSNPFTYDEAVELASPYAHAVDNLTVLFSHYDTLDDFYADFMRTDHHWSPVGAYKAYREVMDALGKPAAENSAFVDIAAPPFVGSLARRGRVVQEETPIDYSIDFSRLEAQTPWGEPIDANDHAEYWQADDLTKRYSWETTYFGDLLHCRTTNPDAVGETLYVSDSFGRIPLRLYAASSAHMLSDYSLYFTTEGSETFFAMQDDVDTVIFIGYPSNYASFIERNPGFFVGAGRSES